jgi:hypothetical protein
MRRSKRNEAVDGGVVVRELGIGRKGGDEAEGGSNRGWG